MPDNPELEAEQRYVDRAYALLDDARRSADRLRTMVEVGAGGTSQARFERDVIYQTVDDRLSGLDLGDASLVFGSIDVTRDYDGDPERFYIGRLPVSDASHEPVVVDWRAPVAEPFYRATGPHPMGLARRRHFASRGRTLLDLDDEYFDTPEAADGPASAVTGRRALVASLESSRSGRLSDAVATIQVEQDRIIRSELPGVLVVQGGPGTGKTIVALHRAAYLLYTYRFPLEGQGVLVVGPNRLFLSYIEQVLPSLGEAGVQLAVLADLIDPVSVSGVDRPDIARVKGDPAMAGVIRKAVRDRRRGLRRDLRVPYGLSTLTLEADRSQAIVQQAGRRFRLHNAARSYVETSVFEALAESSRNPLDAATVANRLRGDERVRAALEWMWPVLRPAELVHELFGSLALLRLAAKGSIPADAAELLYRPWSEDVHEVTWTQQDVPLLDEAAVHLGPIPRVRGRLRPDGTRQGEIRTWGHIVVDEAQDLSPMQLRMLRRRSLNGSMTVVGDIAQATGAWAHADWYELLDHLPDQRGRRMAELTIGYRIPGPLMRLAARVLHAVAPDLSPPDAVRPDGDAPVFIRAGADAIEGDSVRHGLPTDATGSADRSLLDAVVAAVRNEVDVIGRGNVAVIVPAPLFDEIDRGLERRGVEHTSAVTGGLQQQVTVVPVRLVKGLEVDAAVVVEPGVVVDAEPQGMRALYVALTRATKRLVVVYSGALPDVLTEG